MPAWCGPVECVFDEISEMMGYDAVSKFLTFAKNYLEI